MYHTKLHVFDFDLTLFKPIPGLEDAWYSSLDSLTPPHVPDLPGHEWYVRPVVEQALPSVQDPEVFTLLMTGREPWFEERIKQLLKLVNLSFDDYLFCLPNYATDDQKLNKLSYHLTALPNLEEVKIWDDRKDYLARYLELARSVVPNTTGYLVVTF